MDSYPPISKYSETYRVSRQDTSRQSITIADKRRQALKLLSRREI